MSAAGSVSWRTPKPTTRIGADRLERTDAAAPRLEQVVAGRQGTGRDHRAGGGAADANAAERPRQRIADEDALSRHEDALPVGLDQRLAAEVVRHDDADLGKLGAKVARLAARAVAAGRPGLQPLERGRLAAAREQDAAERRQVIGDRAVDEAVARHRRDPGDAGELEHHVGFVPRARRRRPARSGTPIPAPPSPARRSRPGRCGWRRWCSSGRPCPPASVRRPARRDRSIASRSRRRSPASSIAGRRRWSVNGAWLALLK